MVVVPKDQFYPCLNEWFNTDYGRNQKQDIVFEDNGQIKGWRQFITPAKIDDIYNDGPQYLVDMDILAKRYGFTNTFSYSTDMLTQEMFVGIVQETLISSACSIIAICLIVSLITGSFAVSGLTVFSVLLVDLFLGATVSVWDLTFNNIIVVHLVASLGISVLYTTHISQTFLLIEPPSQLEVKKQRLWKARVALSRIGSSVLHGGITTLLAVGIVGLLARRSYFFDVFYKLWLVIAISGMANAFFLIPNILSFTGPTPDFKEKNEEREKIFTQQ